MPNSLSIENITIVDDRMIAAMRFVLAISALIVIYLDPSEPDRFVPLTYICLVLYVVYSAALYILTAGKKLPQKFILHWAHWIDVGCYLVLIGLSSGTGSIFFFFFFFSILVASFRLGFAAGFLVTAISSILFTIIGYLTSPAGPEFELNRFLLRPIYLFVLGYMMAFWGGREATSRRRLDLLKDVNKLPNPRFGIDQTIGLVMERLRAYYDADACLLVSREPGGQAGWREAIRGEKSDPFKKEITAAVVPLLEIPKSYAISYKAKSFGWFNEPDRHIFDVLGERQASDDEIKIGALADLLNAEYFITVPLFQRGFLLGRLYLTSSRGVFEKSDLSFLLQVVEQILPAIENVTILDHLASDAAERQRQKISRDIHDSIVQPFIGIKLGLEALKLKKENGSVEVADIDNLVNIADSSISTLRGYIRKLKGEHGESEGEVLISAVKQQALKFQEFYGIRVDVNAKDGFRINDRLAAEIFQIVTEGLSNIKRHTKAKRATINLQLNEKRVLLEIENIAEEDSDAAEFVPKSIAGRAEALGGEACVARHNGATKVSVNIPL